MLRRLGHFNLTRKFTAFLLVASIVPLLVVGIISYTVSSAIIQDEATNAARTLVADQKDYLDLQIQQVDSLMTSLAGVEGIPEVLAQDDATDAYTRLATRARIGYILDGYSSLKGLVSIDLFSLSGQHYHVGDTLNIANTNEAVKERIFQEAANAGGQVAWIGIEDNINAQSGYDRVITAARTIFQTDPANLQPREVGLLVINLDVDTLYDHFHVAGQENGSTLMVIDSHNRILYHPDRAMLGATVTPAFAAQLTRDSGSFLGTPTGEPAYVIYSRSQVSGWNVVSLVPVSSLRSRTYTIALANILAIAVSLLLIASAAWLVSHDIVEPIRALTERIKLFQSGQTIHLPPLESSSSDEVGELVRWFNVFQDSFTARQNAEEALRESEERYSLAVRGANDGIWDWDLRASTIHYSARWKAILGFEEDEFESTPDAWLSRIHPEDYPRFRASLNAHLNGSAPYFQSEHRVLMADGETYHWVMARGMAVRDEHGRPLRVAGSLTDIAARKAIEERLRHEAMHDNLTGLPNRPYFMEHLQRVIERSVRHATYQAAVLFLDLDRFKIVNDSLGHAFGDDMLIAIAQRLSSGLRAGDTIARFGGDEFAILLEDVNSVQEATQVAARLQQQLSDTLWLDGREMFTTASIGIAMIGPNTRQPEDLLRDADTALYQAKARGRACFVVYGDEMHARSLALLQLEGELRRALERQEFRLEYQPIVSLKTGQVMNVEALIRWHNAHGKIVLPGEFISLAEETGLIVPIGEWVLRTACVQLAEWHRAGYQDLSVSVNISARQLQDKMLPVLVEEVLRETGLPGSALTLEITESDAMMDLDLTVQILQELGQLGVQSAIDDFGNSYSSLGYLKRFPVQAIKIDKQFVRDLVADPDVNAITTAMIAMAHILDLEAVAEGVEDEHQLAFLQAQQCNYAQGYLFSRPIPPEQVPNLLAGKYSWLPEMVTSQPG